MMISDGLRPQSYQTPERNQDSEEVCYEEHVFGLDSEVFLEIPETECRADGTACLSDAKICQLKERELDIVVLDNID